MMTDFFGGTIPPYSPEVIPCVSKSGVYFTLNNFHSHLWPTCAMRSIKYPHVSLYKTTACVWKLIPLSCFLSRASDPRAFINILCLSWPEMKGTPVSKRQPAVSSLVFKRNSTNLYLLKAAPKLAILSDYSAFALQSQQRVSHRLLQDLSKCAESRNSECQNYSSWVTFLNLWKEDERCRIDL